MVGREAARLCLLGSPWRYNCLPTPGHLSGLHRKLRADAVWCPEMRLDAVCVFVCLFCFLCSPRTQRSTCLCLSSAGIQGVHLVVASPLSLTPGADSKAWKLWVPFPLMAPLTSAGAPAPLRPQCLPPAGVSQPRCLHHSPRGDV